MSEFSELIKRFDKIRDYMREFYVYGFKSREDYDKKSLRSYDNEKRRIESYLSDYMSFRHDENGKNIFISIDSSDIPTNPLYRAFKAKSFTKNDITLNFIILDILDGGERYSANEVADKIADEYLTYFKEPAIWDLSTVRNKLSEYVNLGILQTEKYGKRLLYLLKKTDINLDELCDALAFFSEVSPLGVVGSFLLDKCNYNNSILSFKHHYIMHALESEIVHSLLHAIHNKEKVEIKNHSPRSDRDVILEIIPLKFLISAQGGRRYLCAYSSKFRAILDFRLDYIMSVRALGKANNYTEHYEKLERILSYTWSASFGNAKRLEWLKMRLSIPHNERFIANRVEREGRHGKLTQIDETTYEYFIEVFDTMEMLPWIRTFIGRIISIESSNIEVTQTFYSDLEKMYQLYNGGDGNAVQ